MSIAVVIPALNEEETIGQVVTQVASLGLVIVVDDGSQDSTSEVATRSGAIVVRHVTNRGYDAALASGFRHARALGVDVVVSVDADGEQVLDKLADVVSCLDGQEFDVAIGVRPRGARLAERVFSAYTSRRFGVTDALCGVKAYRTEVLEEFDYMLDKPTIGTGVALASLIGGRSFATFEVPVRPRRPSRFGVGLRPNARILRAMLIAMACDVRSTAVRRGTRTRTANS